MQRRLVPILLGGGVINPGDPLAPAAPSTPNLQAVSDTGSSSTDNYTSDTAPTFDVTLPNGYGDARDAIAGDTLVLQISDNAAFFSDTPDALDAGDIAAITVAMTPTALTSAVYYARARVERTDHNGPWSGTLQFTLDTVAPTISTSSTANCEENATLSITLAADESVTWTLTGGADQAKFEISGSTLRWASNGTKDYESPDDADANNTYVVQVTATDLAGNATNKTITVTVTDVVDTSNFAVIGSGVSVGATGGTATTGNYDTTGAKIIVIAVGTNGSPSITDNQSNTYTEIGSIAATCRLFRCINPATSATHTFTASATGFPSIAVLAFSGSGSIVTDSGSGAPNSGTGTSTTPSAGTGLTPTVDNVLVIAACSSFAGDTTAINGGFTLGPHVSFLSGNHFSTAIAYLIQTTAAAADPDFTQSASGAWGAKIAAFKP